MVVNWRLMTWMGFLLNLNFALPAFMQSPSPLSAEELWQYGRGVITSGQPPTEDAADLPFDVTVAFDYSGDIYMTDFSGDPVNFTNDATYEMLPVWSPDGAQIVFLSSDSYSTAPESHLYVLTLATGNVRPLSELEVSPETTLTWSPEGRYIAATLGTIFIVDVETGEAWRFPVDCGTCSVNWLHDSSGLIFDAGGEIFRIDLDGEKLQQITHSPPDTYRPALSPISDDVVFVSSDEDIPGLYNVNVDDLMINRVVELSGYEVFPHYWSPDGQHIAFGVSSAYGSDVTVPGGGDVYVINKDGTDMRVVTGDGYDSLVGWTNDSQHVIYYEGEPGGAGGSYFAVSIFDVTQTRLSGEVMDSMCSYWNCHNFAIRP